MNRFLSLRNRLTAPHLPPFSPVRLDKYRDLYQRRELTCSRARILILLLAISPLFSSSASVAQSTQRSNRIAQELTSGAMVTLPGTVPPLMRRATDLGAVNADMQLESMTLDIGLSAQQQVDINTLMTAQQGPKSPQYHQWLTQEEYGARFGLTESDISAVTGWLTSQGFAVKNVAPSRNAITFSRARHGRLSRHSIRNCTNTNWELKPTLQTLPN